MSLSQVWSRSWLAKAVRSLGNGVAGAGLLAATGALTAGCLDRPVAPATPDTTNIYIGQIRQTGVDKIDLLFMIDNSISMADKQKILADAVPVLLQRLIQPACVNEGGMTMPRNGQGDCPTGYPAEFKAIENIHIGVITSSLGHHGSHDVCSDATAGRTPDDLAQLLPSVRPNDALPSWANKGFLVWDPRNNDGTIDNPHVPPGWGATGGPGNATDLVMTFANEVKATGELGCGYEQQLESWYRFLVDPEPVQSMENMGGASVRGPVNQTVLQQRADFLRRDSLLAIIMLTDENDCSIIDENGTQGWLVGYKGGPTVNSWRMPASTASCKVNPNASCCRPCGVEIAGCPDDAAEQCPANDSLTIAEDSMNQRCYEQQRRFGINLLYPTWRYVEAITSTTIDPRMVNAKDIANPLFQAGPNGEAGREKGLVFLAGIVGVPWQDIATDANVPVAAGKPTPPNSLAEPRRLVYLTAQQLSTMNRWPVILGEPTASPPVPPTDPLMIESIDPRTTGTPHPFVPGAAIAAPGSGGNTINGAEQEVDPDTRDDLQFACVFNLQTPVDCTATNAAGCDCNKEEAVKNSPLCMYSMGTTMDGTQVKAKAYPGLRELQVLRDVQNAAIVASICPKNPMAQGGDPASDADYGYNPAVAAIIDRLKEALTAKCLPRPLDTVSQEDVESGLAPVEELGKVPCAVVESRPMADDGSCGQCGVGRQPLMGEKLKVIPAVKDYMYNQGQCKYDAPDNSAFPDCNEYCYCEINQFTGADLLACQTTAGDGLSGYCYVDPADAQKNAEADGEVGPAEQARIDGMKGLTASCKETEQRVLRFLGSNLPAKDGTAVIACVGAATSGN